MISFERCQGCKGSPVKIINHAIPPVNHLLEAGTRDKFEKKREKKREGRGGSEKKKSGVIRKQAA